MDTEGDLNSDEWAYEWSAFSVIIGALSTAQYHPKLACKNRMRFLLLFIVRSRHVTVLVYRVFKCFPIQQETTIR